MNQCNDDWVDHPQDVHLDEEVVLDAFHGAFVIDLMICACLHVAYGCEQCWKCLEKVSSRPGLPALPKHADLITRAIYHLCIVRSSAKQHQEELDTLPPTHWLTLMDAWRCGWAFLRLVLEEGRTLLFSEEVEETLRLAAATRFIDEQFFPPGYLPPGRFEDLQTIVKI